MEESKDKSHRRDKGEQRERRNHGMNSEEKRDIRRAWKNARVRKNDQSYGKHNRAPVKKEAGN